MSKVKVVRKITEFDFDNEGSSVHLVSKKQGGAANGFTTCIMKSNATDKLPDVIDSSKIDLEKKLEQIKVTMSMEEFLRKFFHMYSDDAELLTTMLGFQTEYENYLDTHPEESTYSHQSYIEERLSAFELMKSLHEGKQEELSALDLVSVLEIQTKIEKQLNEELMDKVTIEKSRLESLEKIEKDASTINVENESLKASNAALQEELDTIKKAKEDAKLNATISELEGLVEATEVADLAKSLVAMDEVSSALIIKSLKGKVEDKELENSDLFIEKAHGKDVETKTKEQAFEEALQKSLETI